MKDPRGIERGPCNNCECTGYELEPGATRAACSYCECPAPAHKAVTSEAAPQVLANGDPNNIITLDVANLNDPFLSSLLSTQQAATEEPDDVPLPQKLPRKCAEAIKSRKVDGNTKHAIVREVVSHLSGCGKDTNSHLEKAAQKMTQKWSPLKDPIDPECKGLGIMLRKRRDRLNSLSGRSNSPSSSSHKESNAHVAKIASFDLWTSGKRSFSTHSELMIAARPLRKLEANRLPGLQLLRAYPALTIKDLLLQEFFAELEVTENSARRRWWRVATNLMSMFKEKGLPFVENGTLAEHTLKILENLHFVQYLMVQREEQR